MQGWIKEVTSRFGMIEIVSKERGTVNAVLTEEMEKRFEPYGIIIDKVSLTDVRPDKDTNKAIKNKIKAQEELETAKVKAEKDKVQAEKDKSVAEIAAQKDKSVAEINAEKVKIEAEAQAQAVKIKAEAEAEANKKISESLTDKLLEKEKIEKWKGDVPQVQGSGSTIIDTRNVTGTE
jgi:regulator of protease activity HflC (stomatin/prohibitin superfamily)